jgi:hypothetical protein
MPMKKLFLLAGLVFKSALVFSQNDPDHTANQFGNNLGYFFGLVFPVAILVISAIFIFRSVKKKKQT